MTSFLCHAVEGECFLLSEQRKLEKKPNCDFYLKVLTTHPVLFYYTVHILASQLSTMYKERIPRCSFSYLLTATFPKSLNNLQRKSLDSCSPACYITCRPCKTLGTDFISLENCGYPETSKFYIVLITAV